MLGYMIQNLNLQQDVDILTKRNGESLFVLCKYTSNAVILMGYLAISIYNLVIILRDHFSYFNLSAAIISAFVVLVIEFLKHISMLISNWLVTTVCMFQTFIMFSGGQLLFAMGIYINFVDNRGDDIITSIQQIDMMIIITGVVYSLLGLMNSVPLFFTWRRHLVDLLEERLKKHNKSALQRYQQMFKVEPQYNNFTGGPSQVVPMEADETHTVIGLDSVIDSQYYDDESTPRPSTSSTLWQQALVMKKPPSSKKSQREPSIKRHRRTRSSSSSRLSRTLPKEGMLRSRTQASLDLSQIDIQWARVKETAGYYSIPMKDIRKREKRLLKKFPRGYVTFDYMKSKMAFHTRTDSMVKNFIALFESDMPETPSTHEANSLYYQARGHALTIADFLVASIICQHTPPEERFAITLRILGMDPTSESLSLRNIRTIVRRCIDVSTTAFMTPQDAAEELFLECPETFKKKVSCAALSLSLKKFPGFWNAVTTILK